MDKSDMTQNKMVTHSLFEEKKNKELMRKLKKKKKRKSGKKVRASWELNK